MTVKNVLYIEANTDGTIVGSHHCLLEIVKNIDRKKYRPVVVFFQENPLVPDFKIICDVHILEQRHGLVIEEKYPELFGMARDSEFLKKTIRLIQKTYNLFANYIPDLRCNYKFIKKNHIDILHLNNTPDLTDWLILSKLARIKIVSHMRYPWSPDFIRKKLIVYYDKVISISNYVTDHLKSKNIPSSNVLTVYDGIDIKSMHKSAISKEDLLREWNIPVKARIIGVIGNIRRWKGQHVAIESMKHVVKKHPEVRCLLIGEISNREFDKEYLKYLENMVAEYGLDKNIIFTGYRKDVLDILSAFDILVHTSIFPEPLGRVVFEGMVFRKPVIATNHGGPAEIIVDGESGFLVPPGDARSLFGKINFLLENEDVSKTVGEKARKRVEETFSIEGNVKNLEKIYSSLYEDEVIT